MLVNKAVINELEKFNFSNSMRQVEHNLRSTVFVKGDPIVRYSIADRMQHYQVPGVSVAVINNGKIEWAKGYGVKEFGKEAPVTDKTIFLAGSISKPITALGVMLLVEQGLVDLDTDVNQYLKRWQVPDNEYTKDQKVTLRLILSHNAGLTVHGFPGYEIGQQIPSTVQILEGIKPIVNTDPVVVDVTPGSLVRYSGGGTTIAQLLIEDVTGEPFEIWMQKNVLDKLEMRQSSFDQQLTAQQRGLAASGHNADYKVVPGGWHVYPEMAAAGLWTTASDLAKAIIAIQNSFNGSDTKFISQDTAREMLSLQNESFGLGPMVDIDNKILVFQHGGADKGFIAYWYGLANQNSGVVVMTNSITGKGLILEIVASVADTYKWPTLRPVEIELFPKTIKDYPSLAGKYSLPSSDKPIEIIFAGDKLFMKFADETKQVELLQNNSMSFFTTNGQGKSIVFNSDPDTKRVTSFTFSQLDGKMPVTFKKVEP
jgi:Beta-lactamase class C and other penicillin binding proteins